MYAFLLYVYAIWFTFLSAGEDALFYLWTWWTSFNNDALIFYGLSLFSLLSLVRGKLSGLSYLFFLRRVHTCSLHENMFLLWFATFQSDYGAHQTTLFTSLCLLRILSCSHTRPFFHFLGKNVKLFALVGFRRASKKSSNSTRQMIEFDLRGCSTMFVCVHFSKGK